MLFPQFSTNPKSNTEFINHLPINGVNQTFQTSNLPGITTNGLIPDILQQALLSNSTNLLDTNLLNHQNYFQNLTLAANPHFYTNFNNQLGGIKRGIPDFHTNAILGSNFSLESEQNDTKKSKLEVLTNTEPSKVLHIRNIATRAQESDITLLAVPFGKIKTMVFAKKTNQALLELQEASEATRMFDYYNEYPPKLNGKSMIVQYSRHRCLELKLQNASVDNSVMLANRMVDEHRTKHRDGLKSNNGNIIERRILRIVIENFRDYPITHLIIFKIFQRFGKVLRIIIFNKNMQCQCLVEMDNNISAHVALLHLNGQDLYPDCCKLRVEFSRHPTESLQIQRQNEKCRDYILNPLQDEEQAILDMMDTPSHTPTTTTTIGGGATTNNGFTTLSLDTTPPTIALQPSPYDSLINKTNILASSEINNAVYNNMYITYYSPQLPQHAHTNGGAPTQTLFLPISQQPPTITPSPPISSTTPNHTQQHINQNNNNTNNHNNNSNNNYYLPHPNNLLPTCAITTNSALANLTTLPVNSHPLPLTMIPQFDSAVPVFVENIQLEQYSHDQIYNLFSVYGLVRSVAFLTKESNSLIVNMNTSEEAENASNLLNNLQLNGQHISVSTRISSNIFNSINQVLPNIKQYPRHAFNTICKSQPSTRISLNNLPNNYQQNNIIELLEQIGFAQNCKSVLINNTDSSYPIPLLSKSSLITMDTIENSILVVMILNNKPLVYQNLPTPATTTTTATTTSITTTKYPNTTCLLLQMKFVDE